MPLLPTVEVTQAQADRILAAFSAKYGTTTTAETVQAYKAELVDHVVDVVLSHERDQYYEQQRVQHKQEVDAIRAAAGLPPK